MFTNFVSKIFIKCQRAIRTQSALQGEISMQRKVQSKKVLGLLQKNSSELKTIHRVRLRELPEVMKKQWEQSYFVSLLKQHLCLYKIPSVLKQHPANMVRLWAQQFECVLAQRIRRGHQVFTLYSKIWEERALREIVRHLSRRGRDVLMASCVAAIFNWEYERISDGVMARHLGDIEYVYRLQESTMICGNCGLRRLIDSVLKNVQYCKCAKHSHEQSDHLAECQESINGTGDCVEWQPFIDRQDVVVWRQEHHKHNGLYAYKVYGRYDDVTAQDFLHVQLDTTNRKKWDSSAVELKVLDEEPNTGSDVLYWEMAWPHFFVNRDYVFKRRYLVDEDKQRIVIRSENTQHPSCPPRYRRHRVTEYWSYMVIKPITHLDKPGIEFTLTYFDNPGLSIPTTLASWVAASALPNFLSNLRNAARVLSEKRQQGEEDTPVKPLPSNPQPTPQFDFEPKQAKGPVVVCNTSGHPCTSTTPCPLSSHPQTVLSRAV